MNEIGAFRQWLAKRVPELRPGERLPSDRELARTFDVSARTIRRDMAKYVSEGKLVRVQGRGTYRPAAGSAPADEPPPPASVPESIASKIEAMVHDGLLKQGDALPQVKALSLQMKVGPASVIAAYRILLARGVVYRVGKRYHAGVFARSLHRGARRSVYFVSTYRDRLDQVLSVNLSLRVMLTRLERELHRCGYSLGHLTADSFERLVHTWGPDTCPFGLVVGWMTNAVYEQYLPLLRNLVASIRSPLTPSVVLYTESSKHPPPGLSMVCSGNIATSMAREAGRYIAEAGHRNVVVFRDTRTPAYYSFAWILKLLAEVRHADPRVDVTTIVADKSANLDSRAFLRDLVERYGQQRLEALLSKYTPTTLAALEPITRVTGDLASVYQDCRNADLWVFVQMRRAAEALDWARGKGIRVPEQLSILSFEDDPAYLHRGISVCIEDWDTVGYQVARAVIRDIPPSRTSKGFVRGSALVLERETTRPLR